MNRLKAVVVLCCFYCGGLSAAGMSEEQKGELAGRLGFGAMVIDVYYAKCLGGGVKTDNHLRGIDRLLSKKWGVTYTEAIEEQQRRSGREIREEAARLVDYAIHKTGGCGSVGMKEWFRVIEGAHDENLNQFHAVN